MKIAMTGATAGIGLVAARALLAKGAKLTYGARRPEDPPADLRGRATALSLDLASLASVRAFAEQLKAAGPWDALLLNAGAQTVRPETSVEGYELTFAANHLAHQSLADRLVASMAPNGRVILTSSGTHDPAQNTGMPPPNHADAWRLAHPETDPTRDGDTGKAGRRAYSTSKLCNVMTARTLARRLAADRPDIMVAAYDPGFTPGTGLARSYPWPAPLLFRYVMPLMFPPTRISTPKVSGLALADLATGDGWADLRGGYVSIRARKPVRAEPSTLARDDAAGDRLWADSEALINRQAVARRDGS